MFVSAKRIPLHPSRVATLKTGEEFEIPSGMGGCFTVRFDDFAGPNARFTIRHCQPPPDGWDGEVRTFPIATLHEHIGDITPDSPFLDDGKHELITLAYLGYPKDSPEITTLLRRFPKLAAKLDLLDRYFELHARLTKASRFERHKAAHIGRQARYTKPQAPIVAAMEEIEASFKDRYADRFGIHHKVWLATRQPKGWKPFRYQSD